MYWLKVPTPELLSQPGFLLDSSPASSVNKLQVDCLSTRTCDGISLRSTGCDRVQKVSKLHFMSMETVEHGVASRLRVTLTKDRAKRPGFRLLCKAGAAC